MPAGDARRNIELKARDADPPRSLAVCRSIGADDHGEIWQRDTYFGAVTGRLKLREQRPGEAQLIHYEREDLAGERESRYRIAAVTDSGSLRAALQDTLGITVVVDKDRHLFIWEGVRIHLDRVADLGSFLEFEAVVVEGSDVTAEHERVTALRTAFQLDPGDLVPAGYADLLLSSG